MVKNLAARQASYIKRLQEVEESYEARLQKSSSCHEQRLEETSAALRDVICQKEEEMRALREANEVDTKKAAMALEATKSKLSREHQTDIDRLNASLREGGSPRGGQSSYVG